MEKEKKVPSFDRLIAKLNLDKEILNQRFLEKCERIIATSTETAECSERHARRLSEILGYDVSKYLIIVPDTDKETQDP